MNKNEYTKNHIKDDILEELWEAKNYYSLSCNSDFKELVRKVREDIKDFYVLNRQRAIPKVNIS